MLLYRDEKFVVTKGRKGEAVWSLLFWRYGMAFRSFFLLFAMFVYRDSVTALSTSSRASSPAVAVAVAVCSLPA